MSNKFIFWNVEWNHEYFGSLAKRTRSPKKGFHVYFARDPTYSVGNKDVRKSLDEFGF